jgi:hypothetical protein
MLAFKIQIVPVYGEFSMHQTFVGIKCSQLYKTFAKSNVQKKKKWVDRNKEKKKERKRYIERKKERKESRKIGR